MSKQAGSKFGRRASDHLLVTGKGIERLSADSLAFAILDNAKLISSIKEKPKLKMDMIWANVQEAVVNCKSLEVIVVDSMQVHTRLVNGLPGEAIFVCGSMAFDTFSESDKFFALTSKTTKQKIGHHLDTSAGEKALRLSRAFVYAESVFGDARAAKEYLKTPNFALGGMMPRDLLQTAEGEAMVMSELQAQADGGPV